MDDMFFHPGGQTPPAPPPVVEEAPEPESPVLLSPPSRPLLPKKSLLIGVSLLFFLSTIALGTVAIRRGGFNFLKRAESGCTEKCGDCPAVPGRDTTTCQVTCNDGRSYSYTKECGGSNPTNTPVPPTNTPTPASTNTPTPTQPASDLCGNGVCSGDETCASCPADCDVCPTNICGNGVCSGDETCASCPADCDVCPTPTTPAAATPTPKACPILNPLNCADWTPVGNNCIKVQWNDTGISRYEVWRQEETGSKILAQIDRADTDFCNLSVGVCTYNDCNLVSGKSYTYWVKQTVTTCQGSVETKSKSCTFTTACSDFSVGCNSSHQVVVGNIPNDQYYYGVWRDDAYVWQNSSSATSMTDVNAVCGSPHEYDLKQYLTAPSNTNNNNFVNGENCQQNKTVNCPCTGVTNTPTLTPRPTAPPGVTPSPTPPTIGCVSLKAYKNDTELTAETFKNLAINDTVRFVFTYTGFPTEVLIRVWVNDNKEDFRPSKVDNEISKTPGRYKVDYKITKYGTYKIQAFTWVGNTWK